MTLTEDNDKSQIIASEQQQQQQKHHQIPVVQLELQNITYSPVTKSGNTTSPALSLSSCFGKKQVTRTTVLHNISTKVLPHQVAAWMGPSGSGKTSLLTVAANLTGGDSEALSPDGTILVNGEEGQIPKRLVGVVWQDDLLLSNLTVRENIFYAARLKTPQSVPDVHVEELVQETLQDLDLIKVQDSLVGNQTRRGISGGERKRVAVAGELVVRPSVLFLDEPTSGLDSSTSLALMKTLQSLARSQGHSIVTVIHQPRTSIFNQCIDSLLLLSRGRMVYDGPPSQARAYLETRCGGSVAPLPPETGIADWIMDVIKEDEFRQSSNKKEITGDGEDHPTCLADYWDLHTSKQTEIADQSAASFHDESRRSGLHREMSTLQELVAMPKYDTSFAMQFKLLAQRTLKQQRGERLTVTAAVLQFVYLFFTALLWWRLPDTTQYIFERNSLFFFMLIAQSNGVVVSAVHVFATERTLLRRERAKKMYGVASYFLAKTVSDMTNNVLLPLLYTMMVYWIANYRATAEAYFKFILSYYLIISTAQSMGLAISVAIPRVQLALVLAPPITLFFMIMGGFYIPFENMHPGVEWASWLSFCRYGYSALIVNEYAGRDIPCSDDPENDGISVGGTTTCPLPGEDVIYSLGIRGVAEGFWFNIGMVLVLQVVFRVAAYWMLRRSN